MPQLRDLVDEARRACGAPGMGAALVLPDGSAEVAVTGTRVRGRDLPVTPEDPISYVRVACLGPHLEQLPEGLRAQYVEAVWRRCGPELDYVRLNIEAKASA